MFRRTIAISASLVAATLGVTACSGSGGSGNTPPPTTSVLTTGATTTAATNSNPPGTGGSAPVSSTQLFGPDCKSLGLTDAELAPAGAAPVGTVAAGVPFLSNVVTAANAAGLTATLNAAPAITVFAPVDDAFKKEPPAQVQALLTDPKMKAQLVATLKFHIVEGRIDKASLAGTHKSLQGQDLTVTGSGENYTVNGKARIICGGIQTKNATVYLIDTVLHPAS